MINERGTYNREADKKDNEPITPLTMVPNTVTGSGPVASPLPAIEDRVSDAERAADEVADPVKERAHDLPPGEDFKERSKHNWSGEALVSEVQRQTGVGGGELTQSKRGKLVAGGGSTVQSNGGECTLYDAPRSDADQLGAVEHDTHIVLLEGPQKAQGEDWWNVQLPDGRTGWLPEAFLGPDPFVKEN